MNTKKLSIIILNYNTTDLLLNCLSSIKHSNNFKNLITYVIDNGSSDNPIPIIQKLYPWVRCVETGANLGFAKGNNFIKNDITSDYVLFLNSDTIVNKDTFNCSLNYFIKNGLGALTCKVVLANGKLDKDTRRSFITPWVGFVHLFTKLDILFPRSRIFSKYWYGYISEDEIHEVDAIQGAFILTTKKILDKVGWFDEDYFLDGEDIDLCWKIKNCGYRIVYYPKCSITHLKGATKGKNRKSKKYINFLDKMKYRLSGVNSMEIFYRKRLWGRYPTMLNYLVLSGIKVIKFIRMVNLLIFK